MCDHHGHHHHKSDLATQVVADIMSAAARGHHHAHDHQHHHHDEQHAHDDAHDHNHDDDHHAHTTPEEQQVIDAFLTEASMFKIPEGKDISHCYYRPAVQAMLQVIKQVSDPADLYEHNKEFKAAANKIDFAILCGVKALHKYKHAYVLLSDINDESSKYTICTNSDLDLIDNSSDTWADKDLFGECDCDDCSEDRT